MDLKTLLIKLKKQSLPKRAVQRQRRKKLESKGILDGILKETILDLPPQYEFST